MGEERARLHARVTGLVQGVGFRYFVLEAAHRLGLSGWVRNLPDRQVEVVAEGERGRLEQLLATLSQGPSGSRVREVDSQWLLPRGEFQGFRITH
jgi:acylphosphatase